MSLLQSMLCQLHVEAIAVIGCPDRPPQDLAADSSSCTALNDILMAGLDVSGHYSGMRAEQTGSRAFTDAWQRAMQQRGIDAAPKLYSGYACDLDKTCQRLASASNIAEAPVHFFKDLNERLTNEARDYLDKLENELPPLLNKKERPSASEEVQNEQRMAVKARTAAYWKMARYLMDKGPAAFRGQDNCIAAPCLFHANGTVCDGCCPIRADVCAKVRVDVSGSTCVAFCTNGNGDNLAHSSMRAFHIWAASVRHLRPHMVVHECGALWMKSLLEWWFADLYEIHSMQHPGPVLMGWPIRKPRSYTWLTLRGETCFTGFAEEYTRMVARSVETDGDAFFFCSRQERNATVLAPLLKRRCMSPELMDDESLEWATVYHPYQRSRYDAHSSVRSEAQGLTGAMLADLERTAEYEKPGPFFPHLLRHGWVHSWVKGVAAMGKEHLATQGIPSGPLLQAARYRAPFQSLLENNELSESTLKRICGNGMHIPSLTSFLFYGLSRLTLTVPPRPQAMLLREDSFNKDGDENEDSQFRFGCDGNDSQALDA